MPVVVVVVVVTGETRVGVLGGAAAVRYETAAAERRLRAAHLSRDTEIERKNRPRSSQHSWRRLWWLWRIAERRTIGACDFMDYARTLAAVGVGVMVSDRYRS